MTLEENQELGLEVVTTCVYHSVGNAGGAGGPVGFEFLNFRFKFLGRDRGGKDGGGRVGGGGGGSIDFGMVGSGAARLLFVIWGIWVLKEVVSKGPSEVVPVKGIQGGGSCFPNTWVSGSIATCRGGEVRGGMVVFVLLEVLPHGVLLLSGVLGVLGGVVRHFG